LVEINLTPERIFRLLPQVSLDDAARRVESKKVSLVAGTLGSLLARPNPNDIELTYTESRLEPFWSVSVRVQNLYERHRTFTLATTGPEVKEVRLLDRSFPVTTAGKGGQVSIPGVEWCEEERLVEQTFAGNGTPQPDLARSLSHPMEEVADLSLLESDGIVVMPEAKSSAIVRQVLAEVVRPLKAQVIHVERVDVERLALCFRPVYAFEYTWAPKGKRVTLECDGLTGEIRQGGKTLKEQVASLLNRDLLFDLSADVAGSLIPGGSIVVKLAKAAVDLTRPRLRP
jgi:hypothetical protein